MKKERAIVLEILQEFGKQRYLKEIFHQTLSKYPYLKSVQKSFIKKLAQGTVERLLTLDYIIRENSKIRLKKIDETVLNILRMSVYQILFMEKIPEYSILHEAVELVKATKVNRAVPYANALLRSVIGKKAEYLKKLEEWKETNPVLAYSFPEQLYAMLSDAYDEKLLRQIMEQSLTEKAFHVRMLIPANEENPVETESEIAKFLAENQKNLKRGGIFFDEVCHFLGNIEQESAFQKGFLHVQDESSMLVGHFGATTRAKVIYDVCAAPGGKSVHLAQLLEDAQIYSYDISEKKVDKIRQNIKRLGIENIQVKVWDASVLDQSRIETADLVVADVPCSGTGVISGKVDLKYRVNRENVSQLIEIQKQILDTAAHYVKKGGYLLYSTCSILPSENREQVQDFLKSHPDFEIEKISGDAIWQRPELPEAIARKEIFFEWQEDMLQLLPSQIHGFFLALLKRK